MLSGTVNAGLGFNPATVPFFAFPADTPPCLLLLLPPELLWFDWEEGIVRFLESSFSIFFRIAWKRPVSDFDFVGSGRGVISEWERERVDR
jgi:hypothetical protein